MSTIPESIKKELAAINQLMRDDFRERVVREALEGRIKIASPESDALNDFIRKWIKVPGFRKGKAHEANVGRLLRPMINGFFHDSEAVYAVVSMWMKVHENLATDVRAFLKHANQSNFGRTEVDDEESVHWLSFDLDEPAEKFIQEYPQYDRDDAKLMLLWLNCHVPEMSEEEHHREGELQVVQADFTNIESNQEPPPDPSQTGEPTLDRWLIELNNTPYESELWNKFDQFIQLASNIADNKRKELELQEEIRRKEQVRKQAKIHEELNNLIQNTADECNYLELDEVIEWSKKSLRSEDFDQSIQSITRLNELLTNHKEIRQTIPQKRSEEGERFNKLNTLAEEIFNIYEHLNNLFAFHPETSDSSDGNLGDEHKDSDRSEPVDPLPDDNDIIVSDSDSDNETITEPAVQKKVRTPITITTETIETKTIYIRDPEYVDPVEDLIELASDSSTEISSAEALVESNQNSEGHEVTFSDSDHISIVEPEQEEDDRDDWTESARSIDDLARILVENNDVNAWQALTWLLVAENDISGAYWLSRSLETRGIECQIPSWLLKVVQGSRWLDAGTENFSAELLQIMNEHHAPSGDMLDLIGLSAAILPSLTSPYSGLIGLLNTPANYPTLHNLVSAIRKFAGMNIALCKDDILGVAGEDERKNQIRETSRAAQIFLDSAPARRTVFIRASNIWRAIIGPGGDMRRMLSIVSEDQRTELEKLGNYLDQWEQYEFVNNQIEAIDREQHKIKTSRIEGNAREQIHRYVSEACAIARKWYRLVDNEQKIEDRGNWFFEQISILRQSVEDCLPDLFAFIEGLTDQSQSLQAYAAGRCLSYSVHNLATTLNLRLPVGLSPENFSNEWDWLKVKTTSLAEAIAGRLLLMPDLRLANNGDPLPEDFVKIPDLLVDSLVNNISAEAAFTRWIKKQDYRFVERLLASINDTEKQTSVRQEFNNSLNGSRAALSEQKGKVESAIEQAVIDGLIADEQRSEYSAVVEAVNVENVSNFPEKYKALDDINNSIIAARESRISHLVQLWKDLRPKLAESSIPESKQEIISLRIEDAFARQDTRVAEEFISRLTESLDAGSYFNEEWFQSKDERDILEEFIKAAPEIDVWLASEKNLKNTIQILKQGRSRAGLLFGTVSPKRREEAIQAIEAWRDLKQRGSNGRTNSSSIATILTYLGFQVETGETGYVEAKKLDRESAYYRVKMSAGEFAKPIHQYGSSAKGIYHVICLWNRPSMDAIAAILQELRLKHENTLVFYLGRISTRSRLELIDISKKQKLALAVLDETLLFSLAQEHGNRLPSFLRCTLPFSTLNPYTPFQAGDVPPEIFYGRSTIVKELQRREGSCIVYGGRQLGKSALLRHVQREFNNRSLGQYAQVIDIKLIGHQSAGHASDSIWRKLRDCFQDFGLISGRVRTSKPEDVEQYIREAFKQKPEIRVLVLFDEADNFLDADSKNGFKDTERLRTLMVDTERRFKVVFAGLHHVQRFQGIPNQPLAHFGTPICVGPLEPEAAHQLISQPLEYLGYRFKDRSGPLRILSYTNYHAGLIQLFCEHLLKHLQSHAVKEYPPYFIEQAHIEAVYRQVRLQIKDRFDWTLALDPRYQAVAWSLIVDQLEIRDSFAEGYPPSQILHLVQYWWPQAFEGVDISEMRGRLDEMVGLGVLVRNSQGLYRLRSPNLVRLMGTESDIEVQLLELIGKPAEIAFEADQYHAPLDENAQSYSPLTNEQERSLSPAKTGVGIVFSSDALGNANLVHAFMKFVPEEGLGDGILKEIPIYISGGEDLANWLDRFIRTHKDESRLVVYQKVLKNSAHQLRDLIEEALHFTEQQLSRRRVLRILFIFEPQVTFEWFCQSRILREQLEDRVDSTIILKRWNEYSIHHRLSQLEKIHTTKIVNTVMESTGGWPFLLDKLLELCGANDDPRPFAKQLDDELSRPNSDLSRSFRSMLGVDEIPSAKSIISFLLQGDHIPVTYVTPDLLAPDLQLTAEECSNLIEFLRRLNIIDIIDGMISVDKMVKKVYQNE